ncbi:MAG: MFS transporter [Geminicoccaceae bacterium]|jgi:MFS family permease|nr:MFS transporter [Geminicoccaceae bacterium]HRY23945.1 MFS transporter [Geminicoccaceae bacterium]
MVSAAVVGTGVALSFPLVALVLEAEGATATAIGLNAAAHGLGVLLAAPFFGRTVRKLGAARGMRVGLTLAAILLLGFPLATDLGYWFILRLGFGAATALVFVISEAGINALAEDGRRGRVLAMYGTMFGVGYALGPLILGLLGSDGALPFLVGAAVLAAGILPTFAVPSIDGALDGRPGAYAARRLMRLGRAIPLVLLVALVVGWTETSQFSLLPVWAIRHGLDETTVAWLLGLWVAGDILFQYPIGWLADRLPRRRLLLAAALGATLLALTLTTPLVAATPWLLIPALIAHGGLIGGSYVLALTLMGERFRGAALVGANAAFVLAFEIGAMIGPPLTGLAFGAIGTAGLPLALALVTATIVAAGLHARRASALSRA